MAVIRTTRFEVAPAAGEQEWIDSWRWESAASLDAALQAVATGALPAAGPAFALAGNATAESAEIVDER